MAMLRSCHWALERWDHCLALCFLLRGYSREWEGGLFLSRLFLQNLCFFNCILDFPGAFSFLLFPWQANHTMFMETQPIKNTSVWRTGTPLYLRGMFPLFQLSAFNKRAHNYLHLATKGLLHPITFHIALPKQSFFSVKGTLNGRTGDSF